jgi:hypothetical protein
VIHLYCGAADRIFLPASEAERAMLRTRLFQVSGQPDAGTPVYQLDTTETPWVQFLDWPDGKRILVRQIGFAGESKVEWRR